MKTLTRIKKQRLLTYCFYTNRGRRRSATTQALSDKLSLKGEKGVQWRRWPTPGGGHIDQIADVIETLSTDPDSRNMIFSAQVTLQLNREPIASPTLQIEHKLANFFEYKCEDLEVVEQPHHAAFKAPVAV